MIVKCPKCGRVIQLLTAREKHANFSYHNCLSLNSLTIFESRKGIIEPAEVLDVQWGNPCITNSAKVKIRLNDHTICWVGEEQTRPTLHNPEIPIKQAVNKIRHRRTIHKMVRNNRPEYIQIPINTLNPGTEFFETLNGPKWVVEENYFGEIRIRKVCDGYSKVLVNDFLSVYVKKSAQDKVERQVA